MTSQSLFSNSIYIVAQNAPNLEEIAQHVDFLDIHKIFSAIVIMVVGYVVNKLATETLTHLGEGNAKRRLLFKKIQSFTRLGIFVLASYLVVATFLDFERDRTALLGLGGTLAVAVGFALKDTASSLMAGILILIDQPFQVGDRVSFKDYYGEIKEIGLRSVRLVTLGDDEVSIPNNIFLTEAVASANSGALDMMVTMDFHIAMNADFDKAKEIIYEACLTSKYVFLSKPISISIQEKVTSIAFATMVRCRAYVIDTRYETAFASDVTERVKREFRKYKIHYPYVREYSIQLPDPQDYDDIATTDAEYTQGISKPAALHTRRPLHDIATAVHDL